MACRTSHKSFAVNQIFYAFSYNKTIFQTSLATKCFTGMDTLNEDDIDRIIEMAWEDRTPFEAIHAQFGLNVNQVIALMRRHLKRSSFERWRKRTQCRNTKHLKLRNPEIDRFKCDRQRYISLNKISKRTWLCGNAKSLNSWQAVW